MKPLSFRQLHLDFHTSPLIENIGVKFDSQKFIQQLQSAKVQSINIFAKCHHGLSYYPTKIGRQHPHLKFDLLGEMIKACKTAGITAPVYFTTGWEEVAAEHAEWLEVNKHGQLGDIDPFDASYYKWRKLCHNKPEYIQYIKDQIDEIIELYGQVDGLWFDIVVQHNCVCQDCQESMIALGFDPKKDEDVQRHDYIVVERFMKEIKEFVSQRLPDGLVYFNGPYGPDGGYEPEYSIDKKLEHMTHLEIESLPSDRWGYNHFPLFVNYHNKKDIEIIGMNGKFHTAWGDFGSLRNKEAMEYECFRMLSNGVKICIGDQMHPEGYLDPVVYKRIGEIFGEIEAREPWCVGARKQAQIGVISSNWGAFEKYQSDEGIMRMLLELQRPFDFLSAEDSFEDYKVIVLPDSISITKLMKTKLEKYVASGGKIIATHYSGLAVGKGLRCEFMPVTFEKDNPYEPSYMKFEPKVMSEYEGFEFVIYKRGSLVKEKEGTEILAKVGNPYFNRTYREYCSHRQAPFKEMTDYPAMIKNDSTVYIAYPIFADYMEYGAKILRDTFELALNECINIPLVKSTLPSTAEITLMKQDKRDILHVLHYVPQKKCTNIEIVDAKIPLHDQSFEVKRENEPQKVYLAPSMEKIEFEYVKGVVRFTIPIINGYEMVVME